MLHPRAWGTDAQLCFLSCQMSGRPRSISVKMGFLKKAMSTVTASSPMRLSWGRRPFIPRPARTVQVGLTSSAHHHTLSGPPSSSSEWLPTHYLWYPTCGTGIFWQLYSVVGGFSSFIWFIFKSFAPEKIYRVQYPSGMSVFRPDLNFDSASDTEVEVRAKTCF